MRIFKYELESRCSAIGLPLGSNVISAHAIGNSVFIWAEIQFEQPLNEIRLFQAIGTGEDFGTSKMKKFIGTVFPSSGLVFHVYEAEFTDEEKLRVLTGGEWS